MQTNAEYLVNVSIYVPSVHPQLVGNLAENVLPKIKTVFWRYGSCLAILTRAHDRKAGNTTPHENMKVQVHQRRCVHFLGVRV